MVVLTDYIGAVGFVSGTSQLADRYPGMIAIVDVVVNISDMVPASLRDTFSVGEHAGEALHNVVANCYILHLAIRLVCAVGMMADANAGIADIVEG